MRILAAISILAVSALGADVDVYDSDIEAGETVEWTSDNIYLLKEKIFVEEGATLRIQPGTVIKGEDGQGSDASALIICRGAKIYAEGTSTQPIIFTSKYDDLKPVEETQLPLSDAFSLWGGVVILGKARVNRPEEPAVEGIDESDPRGKFGGTDDGDNSGVFRYVSIRFGGMLVSIDKELNGLTLGGVGAGTTIDHVEVFHNSDDGIEFFGGCVNTKYLLVTNALDDGYDYDDGFRGRGQFWCCIHAEALLNDSRMGEHDGGSPASATPYAIPVIYNATYIMKKGGYSAGSHGTLIFRDGAGGKYLNSIFHGAGDIRFSGDEVASRRAEGDLVFSHNLVWAGQAPEDFARYVNMGEVQWMEDQMNELGDPFNNPQIGNFLDVDHYGTRMLELRPVTEFACASDEDVPEFDTSGFIQPQWYKGAFDPTKPMWIRGWTATDFYGLISDNDDPAVEELPNCQAVKALQQREKLKSDATIQARSTHSGASVEFSLLSAGNARLEVLDLGGRVVKSKHLPDLRSGRNKVNLDANLPDGMYLIRVSTPGNSRLRPVSLLLR